MLSNKVSFRFLSCWKNRITLNEKVYMYLACCLKVSLIQLIKVNAVSIHVPLKFQVPRFINNEFIVFAWAKETIDHTLV